MKRGDRVATSETNLEPALRDPDVRLMLRAKDGDEKAFAQLVELYQQRLVHVLTHLVRNQETAEDLAQETFLRVYRARRGYVPTAKFSTWLYRIANNLASNSRRSSGRRREVDIKGTDSQALGPRPEEQILAEKSGLMPNRQLDRNEMREVVRAALDELSERQRMALLLHKFEEMSYADIGAAMEMTTPAVKSLLSRARDNLRIKLEAYVKHGGLPLGDGESTEER